MQIIFNEVDQKSRILESLPTEDYLLGNLATYPAIKNYFRTLLKNKGTDRCILYAISLAGGGIFSFDDEGEYLENAITGYNGFIDRYKSNLESKGIDLSKMVYYYELNNGIYKMHINLRDPDNLNQDLLENLFYYLKPINTIIILEPSNEMIETVGGFNLIY